MRAPNLLFRVAGATVLMVCGTKGAVGAEPLTFYGFDKQSHSAAAQEGMEEIFSGRCFHAGVPLRAAFVASMGLPESKPQEDLGYNPATPEGRFYMTGALPSPKGRKSGMMVGLPLGASVSNRNGVALVNANCFECHAGVVNGQVVAGLGNSHLDQASGIGNAKQVLARKDAILSSLKSEAERKEFSEFFDHVRSASMPFQFAKSRGDNFGPYAVWRLGSRLADPTKTGMIVSQEQTALEKLIDSVELPTVDPMPWWLMKYKKKDYWYGDAAPDDASHFGFNFTTAHPEINESRAEHVKSVAKALAFARDTQSPPFPGKLDPALVQTGADLFHGRTAPLQKEGFVTCKNCHGTYTRKETASDLSVPGSWKVDYHSSETLRDVKTDDAYNTTLQKFKPIADHINQTKEYFAAQGTPDLAPYVTVPERRGYIAPPLVGVWASAPYFHNGSVPTLETVLDSSKRPTLWSRKNTDPHAYNLIEVGMVYEAVDAASLQPLPPEANPRSTTVINRHSIYDTRTFGRHNTGHNFGDSLSSNERAAIIEFLKSLSGPDM
jgi:cytochrome c peroxidase